MVALIVQRGQPLRDLILSDEERAELQRWMRRPKSPQHLVERANIILLSSTGVSNETVAERVDVSSATVCKWRERFRTMRLQGLSDAPRSGPPRRITDDRVDEVVTKTLTSRPKNATHWSTREMAAEIGLSQSAIVRIWNTFGLQPHRSETFELSTDPFFVEKTRDIVAYT